MLWLLYINLTNGSMGTILDFDKISIGDTHTLEK